MRILLLALLLSATTSLADELAKSEFSWKATKVVGGGHEGNVKLKSSKLSKQGKLESGEFVMDMTSIDVSDLSGSWREKFLTHIKSNDFFQVEKYPDSKLVINKIENGKAKGLLTIKNVTKPVEFNMTQNGNLYSGRLEIDRTKFGVIYSSGSFFKGLGDKTISDVFSVGYKIRIK